MTDTYRITVDGGAQLARPTTKLGVVADLIRSQPDGRRHVRLTHAPHCVATIDMQRHTFVVFLHGARLDPHDHPVWATQLSDLLGFPTMETRHDQDPGEADRRRELGRHVRTHPARAARPGPEQRP